MTDVPAIIWRSAVSILMLVSAVVPTSAQAGVLSGLFSVFSAAVINYSSTSENYNSQTIPLLQSAYNSDPNPAKGGGDITIVNDSALLSSSGPSGSLADVSEEDASKNSGHISIYVVREGDTLSNIAEMFSVSVNTIRWANDIGRSGTIRPGQELVILPVTGIKYTVKTGGSLRDIIKLHGGNLEDASVYNDLDPDAQLAAGTEVIIPDGELSEPKATVRVASSRYTTTSVAHDTGGPTYSGYYIRPIVGGVRTQGLHGYNAVDLAAPTGTSVLASASGKVIISKSSGWNGGYGGYVVIEHPNGTQTLYAHLTKAIVFTNQQVVQGQVIGYLGSTGRSTGPHLHFEVRGATNPF